MTSSTCSDVSAWLVRSNKFKVKSSAIPTEFPGSLHENSISLADSPSGNSLHKIRSFKQLYLQLSMISGQTWVSIGKDRKFIGHDAVTLSLSLNKQLKSRICRNISKLPNTSDNASRMTNFDEFVFGGKRMNETFFLIHEERVRHPDCLAKLVSESEAAQSGYVPPCVPR